MKEVQEEQIKNKTVEEPVAIEEKVAEIAKEVQAPEIQQPEEDKTLIQEPEE